MSGLQDIQSQIYHETQQPGSMLCAQYALNNLLQGNYFTALDLSDIAREIDHLEESYDLHSNAVHSSTNMDDTGFFSIQVLDKALEVWGLNLTPWRGEAMRPYHNQPEKVPAFILNLDSHWFTLRRFGDASSLIEADEGNGHWYNLNSFLAAPEWVSKTYLGMVITQAEAEGYSVFAVTQEDPYKPLALFRTQVDTLFSSIAEPSTSSSRGLDNSLAALRGGSRQAEAIANDDEDYELQQALQASLREPDTEDFSQQEVETRRGITIIPLPSLAPEVDPVEASMERSRLVLQRMREQQEFAQRELFSDADVSSDEQATLEDRRAALQQQEEEEEVELRRAIEESEALARQLSERTSRSEPRVRFDSQDNFAPPPLASNPPQPSSTLLYSDEGTSGSVAAHQEVPLTVEQIRQARLARFAQP